MEYKFENITKEIDHITDVLDLLIPVINKLEDIGKIKDIDTDYVFKVIKKSINEIILKLET